MCACWILFLLDIWEEMLLQTVYFTSIPSGSFRLFVLYLFFTLHFLLCGTVLIFLLIVKIPILDRIVTLIWFCVCRFCSPCPLRYSISLWLFMLIDTCNDKKIISIRVATWNTSFISFIACVYFPIKTLFCRIVKRLQSLKGMHMPYNKSF